MGEVVAEAERPLRCILLGWREAVLAAAKAPWLGEDLIFASLKPF